MQSPRFTIPLNQGALEPASNALVMNPANELDLRLLGEKLIIETDDAGRYADFVARGFDAHARVETGAFERAIVFLGKHSDYNKAMIGRAWALVKEGGDILVEGAKTDGADSIIRGLKALGLTPDVEPKSHGKIAWFTREGNRVGAIDAWAALDDEFTNADGFIARAGVFSSKGIDKGTRYFLDELRAPIAGVVADFGGGYGVMTREALARNDDIESIDMFEISHRAVEAARKNITDGRANIHWDSIENAPKEHYKVIISNPPFHDGRKGDPSLGLDFINAAARSLRARGTFYMVANRHLPYEHRLNTIFGHVETIAQSNAFKIFKATRPNSKAITK